MNTIKEQIITMSDEEAAEISYKSQIKEMEDPINRVSHLFRSFRNFIRTGDESSLYQDVSLAEAGYEANKPVEK